MLLYSSWDSHGKYTGVVCHSLLLWIMFCQNTLLGPVHLGWPYKAWLIASLSYTSPFATRQWSMKGMNEAGQRLTEFCQENALVIANTLFQQRKRLYIWTSPNGQYWNQIDSILGNQKWRSCIQSAKTRLGADCGSDHQLLIAKFRLKTKEIGENHCQPGTT